MTLELSIPAGPDELRAHVRAPAGPGPWPGVVVLHDALGMSDDLRRQAEWLSDAGFLAVAPDLYSWGWTARCLVSTFRDLLSGEGPTFARIAAVGDWLRRRDDCTGRVGVIGFCMGGGFALLAAARCGYDVSSVNYGPVPKQAESLLAGACPIVGSYGGRDRGLRTAPERLVEALRANQVEHDVKVYPDASHGFMNDHEGRFWKLVGKVTGMGYVAEANDDARRRIVAAFTRHLSDEAPAPLS